MDVFARISLEVHNKFRSAHNVPPLSWSNELARGAQIWAKKLAKEGGLKHDQLKGIGENVFMASQGFDAAAEEATKTWYSERLFSVDIVRQLPTKSWPVVFGLRTIPTFAKWH